MLAHPASLSFKETILLSETHRGEEELPYSCLWKFVSSSGSLLWVSSPHPLCGTSTSLGGSHAGKQMALRLTLCPLLVEVVAGGEGRWPEVVTGGSSGPKALASPAAPKQYPKQKGELEEILLHGVPICVSPPSPLQQGLGLHKTCCTRSPTRPPDPPVKASLDSELWDPDGIQRASYLDSNLGH